MGTLTYSPDYSAQISVKPRVLKSQFGDGYESRVGDGLNTDLETWSVKFSTDKTRAKEIFDWLRAKKGVEAFNWTTPEGNAAVFVCDEVSKTFDEIDWQTVSATFRQVPETALP